MLASGVCATSSIPSAARSAGIAALMPVRKRFVPSYPTSAAVRAPRSANCLIAVAGYASDERWIENAHSGKPASSSTTGGPRVVM